MVRRVSCLWRYGRLMSVGFSLFFRRWATGKIESVAPYIARVNLNKILKWK